MYLHMINVHLTISCQNSDKIFPRSSFVLTSGSKKLSLLMEHEHGEPFRADHSELLVPVVTQIEVFLKVQELQMNLEGTC